MSRNSIHISAAPVTLSESPIAGLVARVPRPVTEPLLTVRNALCLQRLRHEVERADERRRAVRAEVR